MTKIFKEKAPTIQAIEFTSALSQSPEVANLIGAKSLSVDVTAKQTVFNVGEQSYTVKEGEVIGLIGEKILVLSADDFYAKYEPVAYSGTGPYVCQVGP